MNAENLIMHTVTVKCDGNCEKLASQVRNIADGTLNQEAVKSTLTFIAIKVKEAAEDGKYSLTTRLHDHRDITNDKPEYSGGLNYIYKEVQATSHGERMMRVGTTDAEYSYIIETLQEEGFSVEWLMPGSGLRTSFYSSKHDKVVVSW